MKIIALFFCLATISCSGQFCRDIVDPPSPPAIKISPFSMLQKSKCLSILDKNIIAIKSVNFLVISSIFPSDFFFSQLERSLAMPETILSSFGGIDSSAIIFFKDPSWMVIPIIPIDNTTRCLH